MTRQADAHAIVEERISGDQGEDQRAREEIEGLEELYAAPAATFDEVEETEDEIVWFVVLIVFLLTLAADAAVFCWMKGGHLYTWYKISALKVKIGCKLYGIPTPRPSGGTMSTARWPLERGVQGW